MPAHSIEFRNAVLDGILGVTRGDNAPDSFYVELWHDRPDSIGAQEADFGGYSSVEWDSDDWDAAVGGAKDASGPVDFGVPSGDGTDAVRYFALRNVTTDELAFSAPLERPISPTDGGDAVQIIPTVTA